MIVRSPPPLPLLPLLPLLDPECGAAEAPLLWLVLMEEEEEEEEREEAGFFEGNLVEREREGESKGLRIIERVIGGGGGGGRVSRGAG